MLCIELEQASYIISRGQEITCLFHSFSFSCQELKIITDLHDHALPQEVSLDCKNKISLSAMDPVTCTGHSGSTRYIPFKVIFKEKSHGNELP